MKARIPVATIALATVLIAIIVAWNSWRSPSLEIEWSHSQELTDEQVLSISRRALRESRLWSPSLVLERAREGVVARNAFRPDSRCSTYWHDPTHRTGYTVYVDLNEGVVTAKVVKNKFPPLEERTRGLKKDGAPPKETGRKDDQ